MATPQIPTWYYKEYNAIVAMLVQQTKSRMRGACRTGNHSGDSASVVDQIGTIEMSDVDTRNGPMQPVDPTLDRRWVAPIDSDVAVLVNSFDKLRLLTDPQSEYVKSAVAGANRKFDDRIGASFFASANTGVAGGTSTAFDTTNQVVSVNTGGAASGLNVSKLERGRRILIANEALNTDAPEPVFVAITAQDHEALINEIQVLSLDFNKEVAYDENGIIRKWRGYNFIHSERSWLTTTATDDAAGSSRQLPMWLPSGMYLGIWNDIHTNIAQRNDLRGEPYQAYTKMSCNATRLEEKKVVKIWAR